ncbi:MAG: coenzyme F430 synthase [Methanoregula sp.]|nr:MAG: coenzyme F430 synthase [Methanoregula sp.]
MNMLVLDTIHGGDIIGREFATRGHNVDVVDVYRNQSAVDVPSALVRTYDLVIAPVHLDPGHPLLKNQVSPVISHHEAVHLLLDGQVPQPMVEITGARGKTTTAFALAHVMQGTGILHTSAGTIQYPDKTLLAKKSITPASVIAVARKALEIRGWLIVEESLGVTGAGSLAIITSTEDYHCAAGKKSAFAEKLKSVKNCNCVLLAGPLEKGTDVMVNVGDIAQCRGTECHIDTGKRKGTFENQLLLLDAYRTPLMLAGAAACLMGIDPAPLSTFQPVDGRMTIRYDGTSTIIDNSNSGTNTTTTLEAATYARAISGGENLTLVIGLEPDDGAVCDGFSDANILEAIYVVNPSSLIVVGDVLAGAQGSELADSLKFTRVSTLEKGREVAVRMTKNGSIVLAVKTWR